MVFLSEKESYSNSFAGEQLALWLISAVASKGHYELFHPRTPRREGRQYHGFFLPWLQLLLGGSMDDITYERHR
jgi:hypothetical protein